MRSASSLMRDCSYPNILKKLPPKTAKEREAHANRQAAADRGTTFHAAVESWVKTGIVPMVEDLEIQGWLDLLVCNWNPGVSHVEVAWGLDMAGNFVDVDEPEPHVYTAKDGKTQLLTAGRADVCTLTPTAPVAVLGDWKTGRWAVTPAEQNLQVNAAGIALAGKFKVDAYEPGIYYVRDGHWDIGPTVWRGTVEWESMLSEIRQAALLPDEPRPGEHCASCWERKRCNANPLH